MELKCFNAVQEYAYITLLIVPYGIEISLLRWKEEAIKTFNRTLWN